jgi:hypothetical protein
MEHIMLKDGKTNPLKPKKDPPKPPLPRKVKEDKGTPRPKKQSQ